MAALFDTTAAVLLLRRSRPPEADALIRTARSEVDAGGALLPAVAQAELMVGERTSRGRERLLALLSRLPTAALPGEVAADAGVMGAFLAEEGAPIPFPALLIAATAVWLDVPLLTWDSDYARACQVASACGSGHPGADAWRRLVIHPASIGGGTRPDQRPSAPAEESPPSVSR